MKQKALTIADTKRLKNVDRLQILDMLGNNVYTKFARDTVNGSNDRLIEPAFGQFLDKCPVYLDTVHLEMV